MPEEIFDICDENDNVVGQATRNEVHAQGLLHRAVHIWVWNTAGELLVHLRSENKDEFPSCYTSSASGHVDSGEDYETAAHRELKEELNLTGELSFEIQLPASTETANEHTVLYRMTTDEKPDPDPHEIAAITYLSPAQLKALLTKREEQLTPPFRSLLRWWLSQ